jgi:hypothetical protein
MTDHPPAPDNEAPSLRQEIWGPRREPPPDDLAVPAEVVWGNRLARDRPPAPPADPAPAPASPVDPLDRLRSDVEVALHREVGVIRAELAATTAQLRAALDQHMDALDALVRSAAPANPESEGGPGPNPSSRFTHLRQRAASGVARLAETVEAQRAERQAKDELAALRRDLEMLVSRRLDSLLGEIDRRMAEQLEVMAAIRAEAVTANTPGSGEPSELAPLRSSIRNLEKQVEGLAASVALIGQPSRSAQSRKTAAPAKKVVKASTSSPKAPVRPSRARRPPSDEK